MIRSMTAFSRKESKGDWGSLTWELRSVNHRYLELTPRLPESLRELENPLRERLRKALQRGKVECSLKLKLEEGGSGTLVINEPYVRELIAAGRQIAALTQDSQPLPTLGMLSLPGVIQAPEADFSMLQATALEALESALSDFIAHREREGSGIQALLEDRLAKIQVQTALARQKLPDILAHQRQRMLQRLEELTAQLDQDRLEQEMAYIAQRADIDEELDRLDTHVKEVYRTLKKGGACGRRLDFLMQELNREANTLGSKSIDTDTTQIAVELKVLIEQMREQIQNIE